MHLYILASKQQKQTWETYQHIELSPFSLETDVIVINRDN